MYPSAVRLTWSVELEDELVWRKLKDVLSNMVNEDRFMTMVAKLKDSADAGLKDPVGATQLLTANFQLTEGETTGVQRELMGSADSTMWGLANALTATAREAEYERKAELEKAAGNLLNSPGAWSAYRVAEAKEAA